jgi:4-amino-4-deoxy-L-arabinose transferase-like glycosyltransferase
VAGAVALALVAALRIVATYGVFGQTFDEPAHIACGLEAATTGRYTMEPQHPPLGRIPIGIALRIAGVSWPGSGNLWTVGNRILYGSGPYLRTLAAARAGTLPFLIALIVTTWWWSRRLYGEWIALLAALFVSTMPALLGHGGLATNDVALAAAVVFALFCAARYLDGPSTPRALLLGAAVALAVTAKFSAPLYLAAGVAALLIVRRVRIDWRALPRHLAAIVPATVVTGWAVYFFRLDAWRTFAAGLDIARYHAQHGHPAYLLGANSPTGWWFFFIVAFLVKTPIAMIILAAAGARRWSEPLAIAVAFFAVTMPVHVAIGIRHFLPVYPFVAMLAALGAARMAASRAGRAAAAVLLLWHVAATTLAHPDYLAYFNEAAAANTDAILVDSDLDWGQDILRLASAVDARTTPLTVGYFGTAVPQRHLRVPFRTLRPGDEPHGWIALSVTILRKSKPANRFAFLEGVPYTMVGKSIRLYYRAP